MRQRYEKHEKQIQALARKQIAHQRDAYDGNCRNFSVKLQIKQNLMVCDWRINTVKIGDMQWITMG